MNEHEDDTPPPSSTDVGEPPDLSELSLAHEEPAEGSEALEEDTLEPSPGVSESHLSGLLEALVFASESPVKAGELARAAGAPVRDVKRVLATLKEHYRSRGIVLEEISSGWVFRTSVVFGPFVRDKVAKKPVRLTRAQLETLAILAYRQPITRPEIDDIRGVDSGPVLKLLLERDLIKILGKKDEPGRPVIYGTTAYFLEFFSLKSLGDLPSLREFTELSSDSVRVVEEELGEAPPPEENAPEQAQPAPEVDGYLSSSAGSG